MHMEQQGERQPDVPDSVRMEPDGAAGVLRDLQALARDAQRYAAVRRYGRRAAGRELDDEPLEVHMDDLEARARDFGVHSLDGFYRSRAFRAHRFEVDYKRRMIVKAL